MKIASTTIDQVIYFVAVDPTDYVTRETGLNTLGSFTVLRSRDGSAPAVMTTPTVSEVSGVGGANRMNGVYTLLLDEDMTIAAGNDTEEMVFHITCTGAGASTLMSPVTRTIELYRPKLTIGETLTVSSSVAECLTTSISANAITAASIAADALDAKGDWAGSGQLTSISGALQTPVNNIETKVYRRI